MNPTASDEARQYGPSRLRYFSEFLRISQKLHYISLLFLMKARVRAIIQLPTTKRDVAT